MVGGGRKWAHAHMPTCGDKGHLQSGPVFGLARSGVAPMPTSPTSKSGRRAGMSFLVLHMDKFKKDAVRGIQSHNLRERQSHSNPDIDYSRSAGNFDLCATPASNYATAIQNRIDDLLMVKAVRKDAVHMCGLIVSSDREFFDKLDADEVRRFFAEAAKYLTEFVGKENVVSAMVHLDEKTPHMHFLHVPVTPDGRLCAKDIYTKNTLKKLQDELPKYLQECGFQIERGVEQQKGSAKKHLATREFKQQQEMMQIMQQEITKLRTVLFDLQKQYELVEAQKAALDEENETRKKAISEAEARLKGGPKLPSANFFNYQSILAYAQERLDDYQRALSNKEDVVRERDMREQQARFLLRQRDTAHEAIRKAQDIIRELESENKNLRAQLAHETDRAKSELAELRDFILASDNQTRFREFQLERQKHMEALERARAAAERERRIQRESKRQNSSCDMRLC